jgi:copper homeostasis protein CutC
LTSGLSKTAIEGAKNIRNMIREFNGTVVAAGKVTNANLRQCMREIGACQYHGKLIVGALNTKHVNIDLKENSPRLTP